MIANTLPGDLGNIWFLALDDVPFIKINAPRNKPMIKSAPTAYDPIRTTTNIIRTSKKHQISYQNIKKTSNFKS